MTITSVQLVLKYRQNNIHYVTPLSQHSAKHQQRAHIIAAKVCLIVH